MAGSPPARGEDARGPPLTGDQFGAITLRSATIDVLTNALHAGSKPENLVFAPALIVLSDEAATELYHQLPAIRRRPPPRPTSPETVVEVLVRRGGVLQRLTGSRS